MEMRMIIGMIIDMMIYMIIYMIICMMIYMSDESETLGKHPQASSKIMESWAHAPRDTRRETQGETQGDRERKR